MTVPTQAQLVVLEPDARRSVSRTADRRIFVGLIVCGGAILTSLTIFVVAARTGRTSSVARPPVPAVSGG